MTITLTQGLVVGIVAILLYLAIFFITSIDGFYLKYALIELAIIIGISFLVLLGLSWWNTNTASGIRHYKDFQSDLNNGIEREITITSEDGRLIFHYTGKVDIESAHKDNYIKFEGEDGRRYIIYYGIQDTVKIIEKEDKNG